MNCRRFSFFISFLLLFTSCSGISFLSNGSKDDLYRADFLQKINRIKKIYAQGKGKMALSKLQAISENHLLDSEKGLRKNLIGVIFFGQKNFDKAIINFRDALNWRSSDDYLNAQIKLNLASSYFKIGHLKESQKVFQEVNATELSGKESKKFYHLGFILFSQLGDERNGLIYLVKYLGGLTTISGIRLDPFLERLTQSFFRMGNTEKVRFLEEFEEKKLLIVAYLGFLETEKLYYLGKKESSLELLNWLKNNYSNFTEIKGLLDNFSYKMENFSKINPQAIGVVLPFTSAKKSKFAKRALLGIDCAYQKAYKDKIEGVLVPTFHYEDSMGSGIVGANAVRSLIEKNFVSIIIGGLFPKEAVKEYLEAKKYGVVFISLSQIYLPKEKKNHLLIEIPGSVESLITKLFSPEMLDKFGKRGAVIYPNSTRGQAYINEFWRQAKFNNVAVNSVQQYQKNMTDYRDPVKKLLGLKYKRERKEELEILSNIYSLQKNSSIRRIQTLTPIIDFDWVFVPAYPKEALSIIPSFNYYDAYRMKFIGGPSWRSKQFSMRGHKMGPLYFIGDDLGAAQEEFKRYFYSLYKKYPKLIEIMSFDSMSIVANLLKDSSFTTRDELEMHLLNRTELSGVTGKWSYLKGLWLKEMTSLVLNRGNIDKIFSATDANSPESTGSDNP